MTEAQAQKAEKDGSNEREDALQKSLKRKRERQKNARRKARTNVNFCLDVLAGYSRQRLEAKWGDRWVPTTRWTAYNLFKDKTAGDIGLAIDSRI